MGLRDWFYGKDDREYSSQTNVEQEYSASTSQPEAAEAGGFRSSFSSTVTRCEPDETGQVRCRRYVTTRSRNSHDGGWFEERKDEEVPYEEMGAHMHDPMLAEMERMMSDFAQAFGHFGGLFRQSPEQWEEGPRMPYRPPPEHHRRPDFFRQREDEDVFDA